MSFQLPVYQPPAQAWQLVDYKPAVTLTGKADSTGTATVTGPQIDPGFMWAIQRAVVSCPTGTSQVRLYDGTASPGNLLSGSNAGGYDEADYPSGLLVDQGRQLTAVWTGCTAGDVCTLRLQVAVLERLG